MHRQAADVGGNRQVIFTGNLGAGLCVFDFRTDKDFGGAVFDPIHRRVFHVLIGFPHGYVGPVFGGHGFGNIGGGDDGAGTVQLPSEEGIARTCGGTDFQLGAIAGVDRTHAMAAALIKSKQVVIAVVVNVDGGTAVGGDLFAVVGQGGKADIAFCGIVAGQGLGLAGGHSGVDPHIFVVIHVLHIVTDGVGNLCRVIFHGYGFIFLYYTQTLQFDRRIIGSITDTTGTFGCSGRRGLTMRHFHNVRQRDTLTGKLGKVVAVGIRIIGIHIKDSNGMVNNILVAIPAARTGGHHSGTCVQHGGLQLGGVFGQDADTDGVADAGFLFRSGHAAQPRVAAGIHGAHQHGAGEQQPLLGLPVDVHPIAVTLVDKNLPLVGNFLAQSAPRAQTGLFVPAQIKAAFGNRSAGLIGDDNAVPLGQLGIFGNDRGSEGRIILLLGLLVLQTAVQNSADGTGDMHGGAIQRAAAAAVGVPHGAVVIAAVLTQNVLGGAAFLAAGGAGNADELQRGAIVIVVIGVIMQDPRGSGPLIVVVAFGERTLVQLHAVPQCSRARIPVPAGDLHHGVVTEFFVVKRQADLVDRVSTDFHTIFGIQEINANILSHVVGSVISVFRVADLRMDHRAVLGQSVFAVGAAGFFLLTGAGVGAADFTEGGFARFFGFTLAGFIAGFFAFGAGFMPACRAAVGADVIGAGGVMNAVGHGAAAVLRGEHGAGNHADHHQEDEQQRQYSFFHIALLLSVRWIIDNFVISCRGRRLRRPVGVSFAGRRGHHPLRKMS